MFDIFIIEHRRHSLQNSVKLFKLFKQHFDSVYLLNAAGITDKKENIISIGEYDFVNGFNEAFRNAKRKFSLLVDGSLDVYNVELIKFRLDNLVAKFNDTCGSYSFQTEYFDTDENKKNEIHPKLFQVHNHNLDFFVLEKSIFEEIGLVPCIPHCNAVGLNLLINWICYKNKKLIFLDEIRFFKKIFKIKKDNPKVIKEQMNNFFSYIQRVYDLNLDFYEFYNFNSDFLANS